jgi:hypothetical protein
LMIVKFLSENESNLNYVNSIFNVIGVNKIWMYQIK